MIKTVLKQRLEALEDRRENSQPVKELDYYALERRKRRMDKVLYGIYSREGLDGLQRRHEVALTKGRHRLESWLAGHKKATEYSFFMKHLRHEIGDMQKFVGFYEDRRQFLIGLKGQAAYDAENSRSYDEMLEAAKRGDLDAFKAARWESFTSP